MRSATPVNRRSYGSAASAFFVELSTGQLNARYRSSRERHVASMSRGATGTLWKVLEMKGFMLHYLAGRRDMNRGANALKWL